MPIYAVNGVVAGGKHLGTVEAANEAEAKEKGWKLDSLHVSLCHQCAAEVEDPSIEDIEVYETSAHQPPEPAPEEPTNAD